MLNSALDWLYIHLSIISLLLFFFSGHHFFSFFNFSLPSQFHFLSCLLSCVSVCLQFFTQNHLISFDVPGKTPIDRLDCLCKRFHWNSMAVSGLGKIRDSTVLTRCFQQETLMQAEDAFHNLISLY